MPLYNKILSLSLVAGGNALAAKLGNISNIAAPVALISQEKELPRSRYCSLSNYKSRCKKSGVCQCTHVEKIPLNAVVEIVLVDEGIYTPSNISIKIK